MKFQDLVRINLAAKFIHESNLIEDVDIKIEAIREWIKMRYKLGHVGALLFLEYCLDKDIRFSEIVLFQIHRYIIDEQNEYFSDILISENLIGKYRNKPVKIGTRFGLDHRLIRDEMAKLIERIEKFQLKEKNKTGLLRKSDEHGIVEKIADFHFRYERIHPFIDGNGRTGRLLVWYLMKFAGLKPFIFTSRDKGHTYYEACRSQKLMREYFATRALSA